MGRDRFRQFARVEKLAKSHIDVGGATRRKWLSTLQGTVANAAIFAFLIRYGNPQIGEPLSRACQRVSESDAFRLCCEKSPHLKYLQYRFEPHNRDRVLILGTHLRHAVIGTFRGADEKEKLDAVFELAPPWLIWFAFGDYTAALLGLTLPDLSSVSVFARSKANFELWYGLPCDAFEPNPWPNGPENEPLARTNLDLIRPASQWPDSEMSPRAQKRARAIHLKHADKHTVQWPDLPSAKYLETELDEPGKCFASRHERHPLWSAGPRARAK